MRILFYFRSYSHTRPFRSLLRSFSAHGHQIEAVFDPKFEHKVAASNFTALKKEYPGLNFSFGFHRHGWTKKILFPVRELRSYRRYLLIQRQAAFYRDRWIPLLPRPIQLLLRLLPRLSNAVIASAPMGILLEAVERHLPPVTNIQNQILAFRPNVVIVAYRNLPSRALDLEYLKAARTLGVPTVVPVFSWDTLTTKGLLQIMPDRIVAWNEEQVDELREHHRVPKEIIRVVGAYQFDNWLSYSAPSMSREAFCAAHGLRPEDPILLYLGFSYGKKDTRIEGGHGPGVVAALRNTLDRASDPRLRRTQIIVRPHPMHAEDFKGMQIRDTIVLPNQNTLMNKPGDWQLFYDTLHYAFAACVINTTAIIDTVIQDKPGIVMLWEKYKYVQGSTHFKEFIATGAVHVSNTPDEFAAVASDLIDGKDSSKTGRAAYFKKFIRPYGRALSAGDCVLRELEALLKEPPKTLQ